MADPDLPLSQVGGRAAQARDEASVAREAAEPPPFSKPEIHRGSWDVERFVSDYATGVEWQERLLARAIDEPSFAYRRIKSMQEIVRGGEHWGEVILCLKLDRHKDVSDRVFFVEPSPEKCEMVAVKELRKRVVDKHLANGGVENPYNEISVMQEVGDGFHVMECAEALQDNNNLWIVMPHDCNGGEPWSVILENPEFVGPGMPEADARGWFREILECQQYLLSRGVCHGNISPENVLIHNGRCVLTNLGCCFRMPMSSTGAHGAVARPFLEYFGNNGSMSPELFFLRFNFDGFAIDLLSAGITLVRMLTGKHLELSQTWIEVQKFINKSPHLQHQTQDANSVAFDLNNLVLYQPAARFPVSGVSTNEWVALLHVGFVVMDEYMRLMAMSPRYDRTVQGDFGGLMKRGKLNGTESTGSDNGDNQRDTPVSAGREIMQKAIDTPDLKPLFIPIEYLRRTTDDFAKERQLGEGSFSRVYKGKDKALRRKFAVKRMELKLNGNVDFAEARKTFKREIVTLKHFRHPNIARLYAYHLSPDLHGDHCLVFELASHGSLYDFLKNKNKMERLHWTKRINIALDVARALEYLHGGKGGQICYHRDVKSSNVCLKRDFTALLIDCGVAKMTPQTDSDLTITIMESAGNGCRGTPGYICPQFARRMKEFCSAHEVFSLGVVLAELFTGLLQNDKVRGEEIDMFDRYSASGQDNLDLLADVDEGAGQWNAGLKKDYAALAVECLSHLPRSRPKIDDVVRRLGNIASKAQPWSLGEKNRITMLTSDPLVWSDEDNSIHPITALPNFSLERDLLRRCIKESNRNIELTFDVATDDRLQAAATKRCGCLHFSGHGHPEALVFEDSLGGTHWLKKEKLIGCVHEEPFTFVFVASCHSLFMGEAFVKAGVRHVICCEQDVELQDDVSLRFTFIFYLALAHGYTVEAAFRKGKMAVSTRFEQAEVDKFVLLPEGVDHDVPLFDAELMQWKDEAKADGFIPSLPRRVRGREVVAYNLLNQILSKRLVNLVGGDCTERRNMATAICHYINERRTVMLSVEVIYYVRGMATDETAGYDVYSENILQLFSHLAMEGRVGVLEEGWDIGRMALGSVEALQGIKALVVFDGGMDQALTGFVASLVVNTNTKVLVTSQEELEFAQSGVQACVFDCVDPLCAGTSLTKSGVQAASLPFIS